MSMSRQPFEIWARERIQQLRNEADALERALSLYESEVDSASSPPVSRVFASSFTRRVSYRGSKYERLFVAFEEAGKPLSLDEMQQIAVEKGFPIDRNNLRSLVFTQKNIGRAQPVGDGYVWSLQNMKAASAEKEDAAE